MILSFPFTLVTITALYLIISKLDPGWNEFFRRSMTKDLFVEGVGTEDVLKEELPIILPSDRAFAEKKA